MRLFIVRWLLALLLAPAICAAQVTPVQKAVSGIVQSKMASKGVTSNTASWGGTLKGMGLYIGSAAATAGVLTLAGVSAPAWLTAGIAMGIAAVLDRPVSLAIDGVSQWLFNSDGTVSAPGTSTGGALVAGANAQWSDCGGGYNGTIVWASSLSGLGAGCVRAWQALDTPTRKALSYVCSESIGWCWVQFSDGGEQRLVRGGTGAAPAGANCSSGFFLGRTSECGTELMGAPTSAQDAVAALPEAERNKPLNPTIIAAVADRAWKEAAAQPGYTGVPYDAANPITAADAAAYQSANASSWPTVGDFVAPQAAPAGGTAADAYSLPNSAAEPVPTTSTPPVTADQQSDMDWAIGDTGEGVPRESVPVSYTPTIFASPTGCPASISVAVFDKVYAISWQPMCDLMSTVAPIFLACGAAAAALIFAESLKS